MDEAFVPHHLDLLHELERAGFEWEPELSVPTYTGKVMDEGRSWPVTITFDGYYPARPPTVRLTDASAAQGWHENSDRSMCLYPAAVNGAFPWFAPGNLLDRVRVWCREKEAGWPDDPPDLDLHRYWPQSRRYGLVIHSPLSEGCSGTMRLQLVPQTTTLRERGRGAPPRRRPRSHRYRYAVVRDIGEVDRPVTTWDDLRERMAGAHEVEQLLRQRAQLLLVRYTRAGHVAVLALEAKPTKEGLLLAAIATAEDSPATVNLRRGPYLSELADKRVAIIGLGAVGSHLAINLHRAGVGTLTLCDPDTLRPGNMARHAADLAFVGWSKVDALGRTLRAQGQVVKPVRDMVNSLDQARVLMSTHHLVIDATADDTVAHLLAIAAQEAGRPVLCTYLANQGRSKVVEVIASPSGDWAGTTTMDPVGVDGYESGCGDPVSPTPLYEVQGVAAMAARTSIDLLLGGDVATDMRETP
jgi:ThiF family